MRITMMPGENEPVLNPYFEETLENYDEQIASLETQLLGAEEVDKQALEATLEEMQGYRDDFEKNNRYNASEESIAAYREVAGYIVVSTYLGMDSETSNEYYEQRNQYIDLSLIHILQRKTCPPTGWNFSSCCSACRKCWRRLRK